MHPHANMEIMSIVLDGELEHKDSMGQKALLKPGDIQKMSAGTGVYHSELNASADKPLHFLQIWILPDIEDIKPTYGHRHFAEDDMLNRLCCVAAPDGRHNAFIIQQDCEIFRTLLRENAEIVYKLEPNRKYWLHAARGSLILNGQIMVAGDGMAVEDENATLQLRGVDAESDFLLFNLPK